MDGNYTLAYLLIGGVGLVMLFAQARLFSIDATLKAILEELREANRKPEVGSSDKGPGLFGL